MDWFKHLSRHMDNPDYWTLDDRARTIFSELLQLCGQSDSDLIPKKGLAARLRRHPNALLKALPDLIRVGWVEDTPTNTPLVVGGEMLRIPGWLERQGIDPTGRVRKRKQRELLRSATRCHGTVTGQSRDSPNDVTPQIQKQSAETDTERTTPLPPASGGLPLFPSNAASPPASTPKKGRRSRNDPAPPEKPVTDDEITPELRCVWEWYVVRRKRPKGQRPTRKALDAFRAREAEGYDVATMRAAIAGVEGHPYFGKAGNDNLAFLFLNDERVEQLASAGRQVLAAEERDKQMWTPTATLSKEAQEHKRIREMAEEMRRQSAATPWPKAEEAA